MPCFSVTDAYHLWELSSPCCWAGTVCNYFLDSGLNKATLLFPGVACFACAVVAGSLTHVFNEEHLRKRKHTYDACAYPQILQPHSLAPPAAVA